MVTSLKELTTLLKSYCTSKAWFRNKSYHWIEGFKRTTVRQNNE
jgi:hypothetical protein